MPSQPPTKILPRKGTRRVPLSCDTCRTRRSKCSLDKPCTACVSHGFECTYHQRDVAQARNAHHTPVRILESDLTGPRPRPGIVRPGTLDRYKSPSTAGTYTQTQSAVSNSHGRANDLTQSQQAGAGFSGSSFEPELQPNDTSNGLSDTNKHTKGTEFYGTGGSFYFLSLLRGKANARTSQDPMTPADTSPGSREDEGPSVVNLLHSYDYCAASDAEARGASRQVLPANQATQGGNGRQAVGMGGRASSVEIGLQKECVRLYFQSLHCIHPFLDQATFIQRCHKEVWDTNQRNSSSRRHGFLALFYVVLALGAVTAGDASSLIWSQNVEFLDHSDPGGGDRTIAYVPIRIARLYSDKAQAYLGNVFEISSIEIAEALFLMSVFCQNAFKPHSSYMYSGMAVRAALAIGIPNSSDAGERSRLWWSLYCHEVEMCAATGRLPSVREPHYYRVPLPKTVLDDTPTAEMINCMVELAGVLLRISSDFIDYAGEPSGAEKSAKAIQYDQQITDWTNNIPPRLNISGGSLLESELITKQKIILKMRLFSARILLHRPFLVSAAAEANHEKYAIHIDACVQASKNTIGLLYDTFANRPWFRSWWYNCSYALDASMILLYVVLSGMHTEPAQALLAEAEKSVEIFKAMDRVAVTRKCAEITAEVLSIARQVSQGNREQAFQQMSSAANHPHLGADISNGFDNVNVPLQQGVPAPEPLFPTTLTQEDMNASLLGSNLISNFLDSEGLFYY